MLSAISRLFFISTALLLPVTGVAEETLDTVLERMQFRESQFFQYRETRRLALLNRPWTATGDMFITADGMVMIQQSPSLILTKITEHKLDYFDAERDVRRSIDLKQPFAVPGMAPFLQILYGDKQQRGLEDQYRTSFRLEQDHWILVLHPIPADNSKISAMTLSGTQGEGPDVLKVEYTDGDRTEWQLTLRTQGQNANNILQNRLEKIKEQTDFDD